MPRQISSKRRIRTKILEFIAIPKTMKVKVEILPNKGSKQETNYWTDHHKKNCDKDSGVHRTYPKTMKVKVKVSPKKDGDKKQITGLVTTRRIARQILDFIAEAFRRIASKLKVIEIAPFIAQHLLLNKLHFASIASLFPVIYISEYKTVL